MRIIENGFDKVKETLNEKNLLNGFDKVKAMKNTYKKVVMVLLKVLICYHRKD